MNLPFLGDMDRKSESVSAVIFRNDLKQVLLIKRQDVPVWALPGGGIEEGETIEETAIREVKEETGLTVAIKRKVGEFHPKNKLTKLTHLFECTPVSGELTLSDETRDVQYFDVDHLPTLMPPPYFEWIEDALKNLKTPIVKTTQSVTYFVLIKKLARHPVLVTMHYLKKLSKVIFKGT